MLVVVAVLDSLRADAVGFGGGELLTPNLDALAAEGTTFDSAFASAAWTVPSLISLTTGTFPHRVGVGRWRHPFPQGRPTLHSAFAAAGFEVVTAVHNRRWSLVNTGIRGAAVNSQDPAAVAAAIAGRTGRDRFVFLHHWWTHLPYVNAALPRKAWKGACDAALTELGEDPSSESKYRNAYHRTVEYFDRELLPRYLEAAGDEEVLLVLTGDHGENWGSSVPTGRTVGHMYDLHGRWLTDETLRVPLMLWSNRGRVPARRSTAMARGVDVAPTVASLAGIPWPGPSPTHTGNTIIDRGPQTTFDGVDLSAVVRDGGDGPVVDAMTVTTANAVKPPKYPVKGPAMWRRFSLRTPAVRYLYDGVDGTRERSDASSLARTLGLPRFTDRAVWARLSAERRESVGGETLPKSCFPRVVEDDDDETIDGVTEDELTDDEAGALEAQMRLLGYLD